MGGVEWYESEKRSTGLAPDVHPLDGLVKEEIGAIACRLHPLAIVPERRIDIGIAWCIPARTRIGLTNPSATVNIHFIKAAILSR